MWLRIFYIVQLQFYNLGCKCVTCLYNYINKMINKMYFILYWALIFYMCYYNAILCLTNILILGGIDKELTF